MVDHKRRRHNVTLHFSFKVEKRATKNVQLVARFTTHIKPVLQQIRLLTGLNVGGKTRNIAIQLVLQQCCKTSCTFFVARFSVP